MSVTMVKDSTEFALTKSQNVLRLPRTQNKLLCGAFVLYTLFAIPCLIGSVLIVYNEKAGQVLKLEPLIFGLTSILGLVIGCVLGFSKWMARKRPFNYILLIAFEACYSLDFYGFQIYFGTMTFISFGAHMVLFGLWMAVYTGFNKKEFVGSHALLGALTLSVFNLIGFCIAHPTLTRFYIGYFIMWIVLAALVIYGVREVVRNENYDLLKDDYVLVSFKAIVLFPLIPHLTGDRDDYQKEPEV